MVSINNFTIITNNFLNGMPMFFVSYYFPFSIKVLSKSFPDSSIKSPFKVVTSK